MAILGSNRDKLDASVEMLKPFVNDAQRLTPIQQDMSDPSSIQVCVHDLLALQ